MRNFFLLLITFILIYVISVDARSLYKKPHEVGIDLNLLRQSEDELKQKKPDCSTIIEKIRTEIAKYTTQFVGQKRILDERRVAQYDPAKIDKNTIRLLTMIRNQKYGKINFLEESPTMYRLHRVLGSCYEKQMMNYRALSEYSMAFRYTGFEPSKVRSELGEKKISEFRKDDDLDGRYLQILKGFAHPDRIKQINADDSRRVAERFRILIKEYFRGKINLGKTERRIDAFIARRVRGDTGVSVKEARNSLKRLQKKQSKIKSEIELIRNGPFKKYLREKRDRDGKLAYRMAILIKYLEKENKKLIRILNRSSFYRGRGDPLAQDLTRYNRFVGYGIFLELANKIDPENQEYIALLATEYRSSRQIEKAIAFEEKYIRLNKKKSVGQKAKDLSEHYLRVGGLYTDIKNFLRAAMAYEKFLKIEKDPDRLNTIRLHLADIYFTHTGNFSGAEVLYTSYIDSEKGRDISIFGYREKLDFHETRFRIFKNLASISRRNIRSNIEREHLNSTRTEFEKINKEFQKWQEEEDRIKKRIQGLKRILLRREDDSLQIQYYKLIRSELPNIKQKTHVFVVHKKALNLPGIIERQALLALRERNFVQAREYYLEIIVTGSGVQAARARKNIKIINKTMRDGILRRPIFPPDFER